MTTVPITRITLLLPNGTVICTALLESENHDPNEHETPSTPSNGQLKITQPQRAYLFRLLAHKGMEEKAGEDYLKEHFTVGAVDDIPRNAASQLIKQLVAETKEAGGNES